MALGNTLREARMRLGLTTSEIAASTRMKVQLVEGIEHEDFSAVAAPIYGKGFIKLYAERVGVDPAPLVQEYMDVYVHQKPSSLPVASDSAPPPSELQPPVPGAAEEPPEEDLFSLSQPRTEAGEPAPEPDRKPVGAVRGREWTGHVEAVCARVKQWMYARGVKTLTALRAAWPEVQLDLKKIRFRDAPLKTIGVAAGILIILVLILSALSRYIAAPRSGGGEEGTDLQLAIDPPDPYME